MTETALAWQQKMTETALAWQQKMTETATKLMVAYEIPRMLGLSLAYLYENGIVSRIEFQEMLSHHSAKGAVTTKNVDRIINRLRSKLSDYGIEIVVMRTIGIKISPLGYDLITEALNEYDRIYGRKRDAMDTRNTQISKTIHGTGSQ